MEINQSESIKKIRTSLRDLWDNTKCSNIHVIEIPEGEEKGTENLFRKKN